MTKLKFLLPICFLLLTSAGCGAKDKFESMNREDEAFFFLEPETPQQKPQDISGEPIATRSNVLDFQDDTMLKKYLYTFDNTMKPESVRINLAELAEADVTVNLYTTEPAILIFHTHSQESYADSAEGNVDETIVGMGRRLAEILVVEYGISVVHDEGVYDIDQSGKARRNSYPFTREGAEYLLNKYPGVQVTIDLHRDGVPDNLHLVTEIDGKQAAKLMFFNGVGEKADRENPNVVHNMALSLQMQLTANELYPGLARKIYLKPDSYNLGLRPNAMLVELGANTNTVEEARNALKPLAEILVSTLKRR